jgi:hypothetical protein
MRERLRQLLNRIQLMARPENTSTQRWWLPGKENFPQGHFFAKLSQNHEA